MTCSIPISLTKLYLVMMLQAIYQIAILLVFQFYGESILNLQDDGTGHAKKVKNTLIFNGFVFCQVGLPANHEAEMNMTT